MSTREQVLNNLFHYICLYLKDNGETCTCCCPNTSFTFDAENDGKTNTDLIIHTWNYNNISTPTVDDLLYITPQSVQTFRKLQYIQNDKQLTSLISTTNQTRASLSLPPLSDSEKASLVDDSYIIP